MRNRAAERLTPAALSVCCIKRSGLRFAEMREQLFGGGLGGRRFLIEAVGEGAQEGTVVLAQRAEVVKEVLQQERADIGVLLVEEFLRGDAEVVADIQQHGQRGQRAPGGDALDIAAALAEVVAHFIFGDVFFQPELGDAVTNELCVHV